MNPQNETRTRKIPRTLAAAGAALLVASLGLAGCDRRDDTVAMNNGVPATAPVTDVPPAAAPADPSQPMVTAQPDAPSAAADRSAELRADADRAMETAKQDAKDLGRDASTAAREAADAAGSKIADARITTTVNAELAKDSTLSAMKIDVDTDKGRVELKGTAPSQEARERATVLASAVDGVVSVDNRLTVEARSNM
jgi:hyperosmotically inducible periplasmic protein